MLGGPKAVGEIVGRHPNRVSAWQRPRAQGGTEGRVPADCQQPLLDYARARGIPLTPDDFFDPPRGAAVEAGTDDPDAGGSHGEGGDPMGASQVAA